METKRTLCIMLTALLLFIVLTAFVLIDSPSVQNFNHSLYTPIAERIAPGLTTTAVWISRLTHWYSYTPVILLLLLLSRTRVKAGLPIGITLGASAIIGPVILKNIFAIERPMINPLYDPGGFGYPSGHSMNAAVFFGMCAILVCRYAKNRPLKIGLSAFAVLCICAVGLSRIYLGVHTVTDVLGGYLAGIVVICASVIGGDLWRAKRETNGAREKSSSTA